MAGWWVAAAETRPPDAVFHVQRRGPDCSGRIARVGSLGPARSGSIAQQRHDERELHRQPGAEGERRAFDGFE